jgi:SAM-dependent methyltransferase
MTKRDELKAATRGEPSYVWRRGQERRFRMILDAAEGRISGAVLDIGCGIGVYLERFAQHSQNSVGVEYDFSRAKSAISRCLTITCAAGEHLPFPEKTFDLILSHEVLEHVKDDQASLEEIVRLLKPPDPAKAHSGGRLILFVPNRGYPFETHGIYQGGEYRFGNVPFVNYLPRPVRNRLAPHVRVYSGKDLERLFKPLPVQIIKKKIIFGAYDNIISKWPRFGKTLRTVLQSLENTPFQFFGLSHFWVVERVQSD